MHVGRVMQEDYREKSGQEVLSEPWGTRYLQVEQEQGVETQTSNQNPGQHRSRQRLQLRKRRGGYATRRHGSNPPDRVGRGDPQRLWAAVRAGSPGAWLLGTRDQGAEPPEEGPPLKPAAA